MKVVFCGGGSGGHFYPIIAIAEAIRDVAHKNKLLQAKLYYLAPDPYDEGMLFDNEIEFVKIRAGKMRRYFSIANFIDSIKTAFGFIEAIIKIFFIFPDVIVSKGGMMSLPVVVAGRILGIPVIIHESDSVPGRANLFASKFAKKIALSFSEAGEYFDQSKTALTGNPIRKELLNPISEGAREFLHLEDNTPVLFILGGSGGAKKINDTILDALPELIKTFEIIHQTGKVNFKEVSETASVSLETNVHEHRYHPFDYLNTLSERMVAGVATLIISRGGSQLFEIAAWGIPSIIIPITDSNGDHQRKNSFNYARSGAAVVIEENNLTPEILLSEIDFLMKSPEKQKQMSEAARNFAKTDAAYKIAEQIISISLQHEHS